MIFVPTGYGSGGSMFENDTVKGGGPWGAGTIAGSDGSRKPQDIELEQAIWQVRTCECVCAYVRVCVCVCVCVCFGGGGACTQRSDAPVCSCVLTPCCLLHNLRRASTWPPL
jgi:hypothetical protein